MAVKNNLVINFLDLQEIPGSEFAADGQFLEIKIPDLENLIPPGGNCLSIVLDPQSEFDQLASDDCGPDFAFDWPPQPPVQVKASTWGQIKAIHR